MAKLIILTGKMDETKTRHIQEILKLNTEIFRINRDEVLKMMRLNSFVPENVTAGQIACESIAYELLSEDYSVMVDEESVSLQDEKRWKKVAQNMLVDISINNLA